MRPLIYSAILELILDFKKVGQFCKVHLRRFVQFWKCHNYNWGGIEIYAVAHLGQLWVWGSWLKRGRKVAEVVLVHLTLSDECQMGAFSKYKASYLLILSPLKVKLEEQVKCLSVWPSAKDWHWETFLKTAPFPNFGSLVCRVACFYIADILVLNLALNLFWK